MVTVPVSIGEMIDKLSILQVKKTKISDEVKLEFVNKEFQILYDLSSVYLKNIEIESLYNQLIEINSSLWDVEDRLRVIETEKKIRR